MLIAGIILLILGFAVAHLAEDPRFSKLGYLVAVIGVALIVIAVILAIADSGDAELDALLLGPLGLLRKGLRSPLGSRS